MPRALVRQGESILYGLKEKQAEKVNRHDMSLQILKSMCHSGLIPVIDMIFEIPELFKLVDIVSTGENQLNHVIRMAEKAVQLTAPVLDELNISMDALITAILFHDIGKGPDIDDWQPVCEIIESAKVPPNLQQYLPEGVEFLTPLHRHIAKSVQIAEEYNLDQEIIEAIALHHHIKITSRVLFTIARPLALTSFICKDILQFRPNQYAVPGSNLAQLLGVLDQLCAIERKFRGKVYLSVEPNKLEDEVVKDLIIGVADSSDPRLNLLGFKITGRESVILLDLRSFGEFVQNHTEYQVQAIKKDVLNTIRSLTRVSCSQRNKDSVGLIGGDEFVIITSINTPDAIEKMIARVITAIKSRTGLDCRYGYGSGGAIPDNFHIARAKANKDKKPTGLFHWKN